MVMVYDLSWANSAPSVPQDRLTHSLSMALAWGGQQGVAPSMGGARRWDSGGAPVAPTPGRMLDAWARRCDAEMLQHPLVNGKLGRGVMSHYRHVQEQRMDSMRAMAEAEGRRFDAQSFMAGGVGGFPRDFEYIRSKVWEEALQPLTAMSSFPIDTSVPLGARTHTARRELGSGTAAIHRGGTEIPRASVGFAEQQYGIVYIVCSVGTNFFEQLTTDFANIQAYEAGLKRARRLVEERMNDVFLFGDVSSQVFGAFKYPSLNKKMLPLSFTDAGTPDYRAQIRQLQDLGNEPRIISGTRFKPNRLGMSPKAISFLSTRKHETSGGTDTTMLEYFIRTNTLGITAVDEMPELAGIGPNGEEGFFYWRDDSDAIQLVVLQQPTTLPVFQSGPLDQLTVVYAAIGGCVQPDVGNNVLGYANVVL